MYIVITTIPKNVQIGQRWVFHGSGLFRIEEVISITSDRTSALMQVVQLLKPFNKKHHNIGQIYFECSFLCEEYELLLGQDKSI